MKTAERKLVGCDSAVLVAVEVVSVDMNECPESYVTAALNQYRNALDGRQLV